MRLRDLTFSHWLAYLCFSSLVSMLSADFVRCEELNLDQSGLSSVEKRTVSQSSSLAQDAVAGLVSGLSTAIIFHPVDRAIYRAIIGKTSLFEKSNWRDPYQGLSQTICQRIASGGLYFVFQSQLKQRLANTPDVRRDGGQESDLSGTSKKPTKAQQLMIGFSSGVCTAISVNPLTAIKYHQWSSVSNHALPHSRSTTTELAAEMLKKGGIAAFTRGLWPTVCRDACFGISYELCRYGIESLLDQADQRSHDEGHKVVASDRSLGRSFCVNLTAAGLATLASSPFNYAKCVEFSTKLGASSPSISQTLKTLVRQCRADKEPLAFAMQRLQIKAGLVRTALSMAIGQVLFDHAQGILNSSDRNSI